MMSEGLEFREFRVGVGLSHEKKNKRDNFKHIH